MDPDPSYCMYLDPQHCFQVGIPSTVKPMIYVAFKARKNFVHQVEPEIVLKLYINPDDIPD